MNGDSFDSRMSDEEWQAAMAGRGTRASYEDTLESNAQRDTSFYAVRVDHTDMTTTVSSNGEETSILCFGRQFVHAGARDFRLRLLFNDLGAGKLPRRYTNTKAADQLDVFFALQHLPVAQLQLIDQTSYVVVKNVGATDPRCRIETPLFTWS